MLNFEMKIVNAALRAILEQVYCQTCLHVSLSAQPPVLRRKGEGKDILSGTTL